MKRLTDELRHFNLRRLFLLVLPLFLGMLQPLPAQNVFTAEDLLKMKYVSDSQISPDGQWIAYTQRVPRKASDKPGGAYYELHLISTKTGKKRPFITGEVSVRDVKWRPDGSAVSFRMSRGDKAKTQVWLIPTDGGEAHPVTDSPTSVLAYHWHPDGKKLVYVATEPATPREKALKDKGYDFIFYQEDWKHKNLYLQAVDEKGEAAKREQLTENISVWNLRFAPDGNTIALTAAEKNLIDYQYMFRKIYLLNIAGKNLKQLSNNPGKIGNYAFSPDGKKLAYAAAGSRDDHAVSQVYVMDVSGGEAQNLTPENFPGHLTWVGWKDNNTVLYLAAEGTYNTLNTVKTDGSSRKNILKSENDGVVFSEPSYTNDFKNFALLGQSAQFPDEVYYWQPGKDPRRLTTSNPWLSGEQLGRQEVIRYNARDGQQIEGILIYPVNYQKGTRYPLIVYVHGGPESHYSNGWMSYYSRPGQVLAGKGYVVFYPNYRASTGYGVQFAMEKHLGNAAGTEFDDIADGIDYLVDEGIADKDRVGLGGGSYGGFAAAWFGTYYTEKVQAVAMFVGISDLISKRGTTDIPYEELYVHSGKKLEDMWEQSLKRSPIYYAHQSKSAFLIFGGADDTRVSPSQSLELYTRLKMNDHPAVRLVQYPGEGHGNSKQPGRIDVLYRVLRWWDWYVKDAKPLDGPMPPRDISEKYGLDLPAPENN
ncbi:MAG: S9 family peptidase [Calditrichia bacterium]